MQTKFQNMYIAVNTVHCTVRYSTICHVEQIQNWNYVTILKYTKEQTKTYVKMHIIGFLIITGKAYSTFIWLHSVEFFHCRAIVH